MKNEPNLEIFRRAFSSRIEAAEAIEGALGTSQNDFERLKKLAWILRQLSLRSVKVMLKISTERIKQPLQFLFSWLNGSMPYAMLKQILKGS